MSASFEKILSSRSFTFLVGTAEVPIVVHEAAFADQSHELAALMQGKMSEVINGTAKWDDVEMGTFTRFAQFAYTGDYSVPTMVVKASEKVHNGGWGESDEIKKDEPPIDDDWDLPAPKKDKKKKNRAEIPEIPEITEITKIRKPLLAFNSLSYPLLQPRSRFAHICEPVMINGPNENIGEVFRLHAELYVLAEKWGINVLKTLALSKLHQTLCMFRPEATNAHYIAGLVKYVYWAEVTPDSEPRLDKLRELVCRYVDANAELLAGDQHFLDLIEKGGALPRDLWKLTFGGDIF